MGGVGQRLMQASGQAIAGDHIKADAGAHHHALFAGLLITLVRGFKHADLASDVDVMGVAGQAGINHRGTGGREWPSAMGNHGNIRQSFHRALWLVDIEYPALQAKQAAECMHRCRVTPGQNRRQALAFSLSGQQVAGVAVGAVDHPMSGHPRLL